MKSFVISYEKLAPRRKKYVRGNQMPFMTKDLSKEVIERSRLCSRFLKNKSQENRMLYTQQQMTAYLFYERLKSDIPSIFTIQAEYKVKNKFSFTKVTIQNVKKLI